jgi:predicted dinucleotide-binding enzyme
MRHHLSSERSDVPGGPDGHRRLVLQGLGAALLAVGLMACAPGQAQAPAQTQPGPGGLALRTDGKPLQIGVIGSGRLGGAVGALWVKAGHPVMFSSRHPEELKDMVAKLGPLARSGTVEQAIAFGDVILLATPYGAVPEVASTYGASLARKTVLDATNAVRARDGAVADEATANGIGVTTAKYLRGARVVRAFNFMGAADFTRESHRAGTLVAVPIAGDDPEALAVASQLVRDAGFEPVVVGPLASANRFAPGGPLFHQVGNATELKAKMAESAAK